MTDADPATTAVAAPGPGSAAFAMLRSLREQAADRLDPVRFSYLEALARRTLAQQGSVRSVLDGRLAAAVSAYAERYQRQCPAGTCDRPSAADQPQESAPQARPLAELLDYLAQQHSPEDTAADIDDPGKLAARYELKSLRHHRKTWSKLSVDKQVRRAIEHAPQNPGPLNSHMLVLRAMTAMRELSPDYLNRFVSYVDALLWLDQTERPSSPEPRKAGTARTRKR